MPDAKPMSPERLEQTESLSDVQKYRSDERGQLSGAISELLAEVRRLQSSVDRLANAERDLAETNLVLEQQDRQIAREVIKGDDLQAECDAKDKRIAELEQGVAEGIRYADSRDRRIAELEAGLREALQMWRDEVGTVDDANHDRLLALASGTIQGAP